MARLTVEDCLENVPNRFDLVLLATKRARQIARGSEPRLPENNDKPTVLALREIAEGLIDREAVEAIELKEHSQQQFGILEAAPDMGMGPGALDEPPTNF